ncbi:hypothetical protein DFS33DRAFT_1274544 [Desarmillaria ectypa]|nr:hypothetical protein DFS33DRAFT_1274544 [Desarmillaria ectypa]
MSGIEVLLSRDEQLGSLLVSLVVSAAMYGIATSQVYLFFKSDGSRPRDPKIMQGFPLPCQLTLLLDTLQQASVTQGVYWYLVSNFDEPSDLKESTCPLIGNRRLVMSRLLHQGERGSQLASAFGEKHRFYHFYVRLEKILAVAMITLPLAIGVKISRQYNMFEITRRGPRLSFYVTLGAGIGADICIAICLCCQLSSSRPTIPGTRTVVDKIIRYAISTCVLTSLIATVSFMVLTTRPSSMIFIAMFCLLSKFYFNTLMATLNSRIELRRHLDAPAVVLTDCLHDNETGTDQNIILYQSRGKEKSRHNVGLASTSDTDIETGLRLQSLVDRRYIHDYGGGEIVAPFFPNSEVRILVNG